MGAKIYGVRDDDGEYVASNVSLKDAVRQARFLRDNRDEIIGTVRVVKQGEEDVAVDLDAPEFMTRTELRERLGKAKEAEQAAIRARNIMRDQREVTQHRLIHAGFIPVEIFNGHVTDMRITHKVADPFTHCTLEIALFQNEEERAIGNDGSPVRHAIESIAGRGENQ